MPLKKLESSFFTKHTVEVAKDLLGCVLSNGKTSGVIVETEAYLHNDPAAHSFNGLTKRNAPMFGKPGTAYVYFTYGMHHCFNVVTNKKGIGEAVLIRALEPLDGIELMKKRRRTDNLYNLCSGPAKLVQALGITIADNRSVLSKGNLKITEGVKPEKIVTKKRIGILKGTHLPLRFYIKNNKFISRS